DDLRVARRVLLRRVLAGGRERRDARVALEVLRLRAGLGALVVLLADRRRRRIERTRERGARIAGLDARRDLLGAADDLPPLVEALGPALHRLLEVLGALRGEARERTRAGGE